MTLTVNAEVREERGKSAARRMRRGGMVSGIVYGGKKDPMPLKMQNHMINNLIGQPGVSSSVMDLNIDGNVEKVILKELHRHPIEPKILHMDFLRIDDAVAIKVLLPLRFVGMEISPGIKAGGEMTPRIVDVDISCLPGHLPQDIQIDVSKLEAGDAVHLSQIEMPEGVTLIALTHGHIQDYDQSVVTISKIR